jgi:hypothetical protein
VAQIFERRRRAMNECDPGAEGLRVVASIGTSAIDPHNATRTCKTDAARRVTDAFAERGMFDAGRRAAVPGNPGATFDSLGIVIIRVCLAAWAPSTLVDRLGEIDEQKMQVAR